jgi:hypothetical protein
MTGSFENFRAIRYARGFELAAKFSDPSGPRN